jgi:pimeloyl-ACP methyl ester carboxylesterase
MDTDVADMEAVADAAGPLAAAVGNGDAANRAVHLAARRPDLVPAVVALESVPLTPGDADGVESLVGSGGVLSALEAIMRTDYRAGLHAALEPANPGMTQHQVRERIDRTTAYVRHDASIGRLDAWIRDQPGADSAALGERLTLAYEGAGGWFPAALYEQARTTLPDAHFVKLDGGAISRPELTAAVVRGVTGV